jgi:hypothetical protein
MAQQLGARVVRRCCGYLILAAACADRPLSTSPAQRGYSHEDSLAHRLIRPQAQPRMELQGESPPCDPALADCAIPLTVYADPSWRTGASQPDSITFSFLPAVRSIRMTGTGLIYCSGTYGTLTAYTSDSIPITSARIELDDPADCSPPENPDNVTYATRVSLESDTIPIAYATLSPMAPLTFDVLGQPGRASQTWWILAGRSVGKELRILEALGVNDGSFLAGSKSESRVTLRARTDPSIEDAVTWEVSDYADDDIDSPLPPPAAQGTVSSFNVPATTHERWRSTHPQSPAKWLPRASLAYEVRLRYGEHLVGPALVRQDALDTQRQEYIDLRVPQGMVPRRGSLGPHPFYLKGDYELAVINPAFDDLVTKLALGWKPNPFVVNGLYRNPVHNAYHVDKGKSSGTVSASWHQYGCGMDLQTLPGVDETSTPKQIAAARLFWDGLAEEARQLGLRVEQRDPDPTKPKKPFSGVGHVHVETRCYQ